jgi:DNA polymerase-1
VVAALKPLLEDPAFPLVLADVKNERLCWEELGVTLRGERFGATLASYLIDPERHGHTLEDIAQSELRRTLESFDAVTEKRGRKRLALDEVELERVMAYAGERACLALAAESRLTPRLEGQHLEGLLKDVELPLSRVLAQLERDGIRLDPAPLAVLSEEAVARMAELEEEAYAAAGHAFAINSPRALEAVLFDELELPVIKKTKTARSTDQSVLEELSPQHPLPALVLEHRTLAKLKSTYLDALPQAVHPRTGRIHSRFNQAVTATGRVSSSEPNLQNIPIRTDWGRRIRGAFVPQEGWRLMSADYSQIELRVLAHLSEDEALVDAFTSGADVHDRTARALFELDADAEVDRFQRNAAKTVNYAVIYGQTQWALARNLGIERSEAKRYIDAFFARYAGVAAFMERTVEDACKVGGVRTILGRWRALPDIRSRNRGQRGAAERMARNTPIQGSAADLLKVAMVKVADALEAHESRMLLTVHDELVFEIAPGEEEAVAAVCREHMEHAWELRVPLVVDVGVGPSWMEAH